MNKKDLENKLASLRAGASLDYSCRSSDNKGTEEINIYDIISQILKLSQAHTTEELLKIVTQNALSVSYCAECQKGTKNILIKNAFCPQCFDNYQKRLKEVGLKI